jgi:2-polyprenyl-3-methyl-5-hydroxy-6-metoxy-1,4-benzoquinol methylase
MSQLVRGALRASKWTRQGVRRKRRAVRRTWKQVGQGVQRWRRAVRRTWRQVGQGVQRWRRAVLRTWKRAVLRTWKRAALWAWKPVRRAGWLIGVAARVDPWYSPAGEQRTCPACGGTRIKHLDVRRWQSRGNDQQAGFISGCVSCGLVFVNPMPTPEALAKRYTSGGKFAEGYEKRWREGRATVGLSPLEKRRKLSQRFATVVPHLDVMRPPAGAKVLDYGCDSGRMLDQLQAVGWSTFGFEPGIKVAFTHHQEVVELPGVPTFDLVIAHHVLEHLLNPFEVLRTLAGSMVKGGVLHLSVPRFDAADRHDHLAHAIRPGSKHILAFTRDCLVTLLTREGLRVLETTNDVELNKQLTRLPLFAIKEAPVGTEPVTPLRSAERVLYAHAARFGQGQRGMRRWIPLRLQASWLERSSRSEPETLRGLPLL